MYSASCSEEILLIERLNELCGFWNCRLKIFVGSGSGPNGLVPQREILLHKLDRVNICAEVETEGRYLVCGSKHYMQEVLGVLSDNGVKEDYLHRF